MSSVPEKSSAEKLATPVQFLKGVGPHRAELLARLDLRTARDVLFFFPRDYQDMSRLRAIEEFEEGKPMSVCGTVEEIELRNMGPGHSLLGVLVRQGNEFLRAVWFNQAFMRNKFSQGHRVLLSGTAKFKGGRWEMTHPHVELLDQNEEPKQGSVWSVYQLTEGINQAAMRKIVMGVVESCVESVDEVFPEPFLTTHNLWPIRRTLTEIHKPSDLDSLESARQRLIYQELFILQLALAIRRRQMTIQSRAPSLPSNAKIDSRILRLFPFELTADQRQSIDEISADMARDFPMNRLLQGDVGSGKTVVAEYAMLLAVAHGHQAALMAPTEVLARQHAQTLEMNLRESKVRIALLTGSVSDAQRRNILNQIATGQVDLLVGTQAILQADVKFAKLGLVVIDEQHKFGVRQRATLKQAGIDPHYLVMTATPIPRTVSMTLFGDLDVSTLRESPPGRQKVHTYLAGDMQREKWWEFFRKKLREGRQGFVVTPLIDQSDTIQVASLQQTFEELANDQLEAFRLDLIHGRQSSTEKEATMRRFRSGQTQVLLATSVVEVGIDVPNATLMTIEGGERFGLAQLHQLRGRISRGNYPGYLCVFADPQTEPSKKRLAAFTETTDGFELAELDFILRGPGDLFGDRQHGLPPLRIADLLRDEKILAEARRAAQKLIADDPELSQADYQRLRRMILIRYGKALEISDVG